MEAERQERGTQVNAAFITPECRTGRGDEGAWEEAVARLKHNYDQIVEGWAGEDKQPTLNLILTMERPAPMTPDPAKGERDELIADLRKARDDALRAAEEAPGPFAAAPHRAMQRTAEALLKEAMADEG